MPALHLVPMFFSSWMCSRRANLTETIDDDDDDDDLDLLSLPFDSNFHGYHDDRAAVISVTEEDDDDDESLDEFLFSWTRQQQKPHLEITSSKKHWDCVEKWSSINNNNKKCSTDEDECASLSLSRPLEQMVVIPFVSLHFDFSEDLDDSTESTTSEDDDDDDLQQQADIDEALYGEKTPLNEMAGARDEPPQPSLSLPAARTTTEATTSAAAATTTTRTSPSSPNCFETQKLTSRGVPVLPSTTITATLESASPPAAWNRAAPGKLVPTSITSRTFSLPPSPPRSANASIWPSIPSEIVLSTTSKNASCETTEEEEADVQRIWDPARPLIWDQDWDSHALDIDSSFADACRTLQSLLQNHHHHHHDDDEAGVEDERRILQLLARYPETCLVRFKLDHSFQYPLHWCCRQGWLTGIQQCYRAIPEVIGYALDSMLPLHVATQQSCSLEIVDFLCQRYPTALKHTNTQLQTPLHLAVLSHADEAVIECVLRWYPTAAQLADVHGWTPTHYVCQNGSARVLRLLLLQDPSVAVTVTRNLEKPLHIAAQCNAGDLIRVLLETTFSSDVDTTSATTSTRTACATSTRDTSKTTAATASTMVISSSSSSSLSSLRPRCGSTRRMTSPASCTDSKFFTPLHYLATHGSWMDLAVLKLLVEAYPAAKYMTSEDDCTPYDLAVKAHARQELLSLLQ